MSVQLNIQDKSLSITGVGRYECSIKIHNRLIEKLEGGCYIRGQVFLPIGSKLEVYNKGQILTRRFYPVSAADFLKMLDNARFGEPGFQVIEEYLSSYAGTGGTPELTANQLGIAVSKFIYNEERLKALRKLHHYVIDRDNLGSMIDDRFSYFDREEARRIVGI